VIQKKKKKSRKGVSKEKKKKKERKDLGLTIDVQRQKVYFGKEIVLIGERVEKKN
jgi:hypothetical protein